MNTDQLSSLLEDEFIALKNRITEPGASMDVIKARYQALTNMEKCVMLSYLQINSGMEYIEDFDSMLTNLLSDD